MIHTSIGVEIIDSCSGTRLISDAVLVPSFEYYILSDEPPFVNTYDAYLDFITEYFRSFEPKAAGCGAISYELTYAGTLEVPPFASVEVSDDSKFTITIDLSGFTEPGVYDI